MSDLSTTAGTLAYLAEVLGLIVLDCVLLVCAIMAVTMLASLIFSQFKKG